MASNGIYLAGPVQWDDNPRTWRDDIRERYPDVEWIDPMDWQDEWEQTPGVVWDRELYTCRNADVLVCNFGTDAPRTTGTHHEIRVALNHGRNVAIVPSGEISQIYRELEDVMIFDDVDEAVKSLVAIGEVAADGGTASTGVEWDRKASENIEKWGVQHPETVLAAISEEVGEVNQAYLEATYEGGNAARVHEEIDDLGALILQFALSVEYHPDAFNPLGTVQLGDEL